MSTPKVAVVTGSGKKRVGWHVASALLDRGYAVAVHYRTSAVDAERTVAEFTARGGQAASFQANLADERAVQRFVADVLERFGRIDALALCAATWQSRRLEEVTAADVRGFFEANVLSTFLCCQRFGLVMARQAEGGSIITFGDWAIARPYLHYAAYFPSKGAIPALTRSMAVELGSRNPLVRVNCIQPGPVMLPDDLPAAERAQAIAGTLVKREGSPEHVAQAVLHLIENDFITGVCLPIDGGRTIYSGDSGEP